jgi:hypothetical protein
VEIRKAGTGIGFSPHFPVFLSSTFQLVWVYQGFLEDKGAMPAAQYFTEQP